MNGSTAATRLRDVVVVHDQSGARWRAGRAMIRNGRIVVLPSRTEPPDAFFGEAASTYSIEAMDGGDRARRFAQLVLSHRDSDPPKEYVFE